MLFPKLSLKNFSPTLFHTAVALGAATGATFSYVKNGKINQYYPIYGGIAGGLWYRALVTTPPAIEFFFIIMEPIVFSWALYHYPYINESKPVSIRNLSDNVDKTEIGEERAGPSNR